MCNGSGDIWSFEPEAMLSKWVRMRAQKRPTRSFGCLVFQAIVNPVLAANKGKVCAEKTCGMDKGERLDNDPNGSRYGCFLPDLTGLARRSPAPTSRGRI
ncbi:hypothetical protein MASR1M32_11880 [Rhodobacter sp.]